MSISNSAARDASREDAFQRAQEYGRSNGDGDRGLVLTASIAVDEASNGNFDISKPVTGKGVKVMDDAERLYARYQEGYTNGNAHGSITQQASKLRAFIKLGMHPLGLRTFKRAIVLWTATRENEAGLKKSSVQSEYKSLYAVALTQVKCDDALTDDEIMGVMRVAEGKETTVAEMIKRAHKTLDDAHGKASVDNSLNDDQLQHIADALGNLSGVLAMIEAHDKMQADLILRAELNAKYALAA